MNDSPRRIAPSTTTPQSGASDGTDARSTDEIQREDAEGERFMRGVLIAMAVTFVLGVIGIAITIHLG